MDRCRRLVPGFMMMHDIWPALLTGEYETANEILQRWQLQNPGTRNTLAWFGKYYLFREDYNQAVTYFEEAFENPGDKYQLEPLMEEELGYAIALWNTERKEDGEKRLRQLLNEYLKLDRFHILDRELRIAAIYAILDEKKEAYHWLYKSKFVGFALYEIDQDIWFSNINKEEAFHKIARSLKDERRQVREEIARLKAADEWDI